MILKSVIELCWRLYQNGRAYANNQYVLKEDMEQKAKLLFSDALRQRYYESKKLDEFGRPDFSFVSPLLEIKRFELKDVEDYNHRRCDMSGIQMYRMPGNSHITNVYPVGSCTNDELGEITQVNPGEENFYANDPDFSGVMFWVIKGKGVNVYNIPPCIKSLDIEATYDGPSDQVEIDSAMASVIVDQILNVSLGIKKQYYSEAQKQMAEQNIVR